MAIPDSSPGGCEKLPSSGRFDSRRFAIPPRLMGPWPAAESMGYDRTPCPEPERTSTGERSSALRGRSVLDRIASALLVGILCFVYRPRPRARRRSSRIPTFLRHPRTAQGDPYLPYVPVLAAVSAPLLSLRAHLTYRIYRALRRNEAGSEQQPVDLSSSSSLRTAYLVCRRGLFPSPAR